MSDGINKVFLLGEASQVELTQTKNGYPCLKFKLCTTSSYPGKDGERKESQAHHSCAVYGKRAQSVQITEGTTVLVEGSIKYSGEKKQMEISADNITVITVERSGPTYGDENGKVIVPFDVKKKTYKAGIASPSAQDEFFSKDDDIPF